MKYTYLLIMSLFLFSCGQDENPNVKNGTLDKTDDKLTIVKDGQKSKALPDTVDFNVPREVVDEKVLSNGIKIKWYVYGGGEVLNDGDMVDLEYRVSLEGGKVFDGNHLLNRKSIPFMIGYKMQGETWDMILKNCKVGDFIEVFLPSKYARGEKGIPGLVPKNANNILKMRILSKRKPDREIDGTRVWLFDHEPAHTVPFGPGKRIKFHVWMSSPSYPMYFNTAWKNSPYDYSHGMPGLVPGLQKALNNAKKSDLMFIHIPASEAYGSKGFNELVKANEDLLYSVTVLDITE